MDEYVKQTKARKAGTDRIFAGDKALLPWSINAAISVVRSLHPSRKPVPGWMQNQAGLCPDSGQSGKGGAGTLLACQPEHERLHRQAGAVVGIDQNPDGQAVRVGLNQHMGLDQGRVIKITNTHVDLMETVPDGKGCWVTRKPSWPWPISTQNYDQG